ncbi:Rhodopsin domain-containing protein [Madurella fahalii]|uniref:Rhodopsin domain-containing protein n=1 Tax=Madurella fahalii TaxID=1157608 RepID=A0ABQ0GGX6_9PEZI
MASNSEYAGYRLEILVSIFTPVQVAAVVIRFYSRTLTVRPYTADDWLVIASLLSQFVMAASILASVKLNAIGDQAESIVETDPAASTRFYQFLVFWSVWYLATFSLPKLAICLLYRRLFPQRAVSIIMWLTAIVLVATVIAGLIANLAACRPFDAHWAHPEVQRTHCIDKVPLFLWVNFPNIVTDIVMLILPLPIVWKLRISFQLKVALTTTFLIGSTGLAASILRFRSFADNNSAVELLTWTLLEPGIYLISACLLMCRPLLDKFSRKFGWTNNRHSEPYASSNPHKLRRSVEDGDVHDSTTALESNTTTEGALGQLSGNNYNSSNNIIVTTNINQSWEGPSVPTSDLDR